MKVAYDEQEVNPWEAQSTRADLAARKLDLDPGLWKVLRYPDREIVLCIPVQMDDRRLELFTGYRVQHSISVPACIMMVPAFMVSFIESPPHIQAAGSSTSADPARSKASLIVVSAAILSSSLGGWTWIKP
jgi:hypothetical protein